ncbi:MAG: SpoIIE family protein phosphatase [Bacteroidia bacterium]|nr:SpoIIE family protein phosphatase [Bacteroidia bacterium]
MSSLRSGLIVVLFILWETFSISAQHSIHIHRYTGADGFEPISQCITDNMGYTWMISVDRSSDRLIRFNGSTFKIYSKQTGSHWLSFVHAAWRANRDPLPIFKDSAGSVWMGSMNGVFKMVNGEPEKIFGRENGMPSDSVISMCLDKRGALWVFTYKGLGKFFPAAKNGKWEPVAPDFDINPSAIIDKEGYDPNNRNPVFNLELDESGRMWWGISYKEKSAYSKWWVCEDGKVDSVIIPMRFNIVKFLEKGIYISDFKNKSGFYDFKKGFSELPLPLYYLGDDDGGYHYFASIPETGPMELYATQQSGWYQLNKNNFFSLGKVSGGGDQSFFNSDVGPEVWIYDFTPASTFSYVLKNGHAFVQDSLYPGLELFNSLCYSAKPGVIWVQKMQKTEGKLVTFELNREKIIPPVPCNGLAPQGVSASDSSLFTLLENKHIEVFKYKNGEWKKTGLVNGQYVYIDDSGGVFDTDSARQFLRYYDPKGNLTNVNSTFRHFSASHGGIFFTEKNDTVYRHVKGNREIILKDLPGDIRMMQSAPDNAFYLLTTDEKIYYWSGHNRTIQEVSGLPDGIVTRFQDLGYTLFLVKNKTPFLVQHGTAVPLDTVRFPNLRAISYVAQDRNNRIFFLGKAGSPTFSEILLYTNGEIRVLHLNKPLSTENISLADVERGSNEIILCSGTSIYRYSNEYACFYLLGDVSEDIGFIWKAVVHQGQAFVGGWGPNLVTFDLDKIKPKFPTLHFTTLSLSGKEFPDSFPTQFPSGESFRISYLAIADFNQEAVRYQTRIPEIDSAWSTLTTNQDFDFISLPAGQYTFQVRAMDRSMVWSTPIQFKFTILPPWYFTWWAIAFFTAGGLLLVLGIVKWNGRRLEHANRQLNQKIQQATQEIRGQKDIIEHKNKEITDSILYAQRIQQALLASATLLEKNLPPHFILFLPKDIVSGDFYWALEKEGDFYLAVCDSTGHGVPGAFMSLLNITIMNEAIMEKDIRSPEEVFNYTRERLLSHLAADEVKDGMDGIMVRFSRSGKITYAAANNPPLLVTENGLQELEYDKIPVGRSEKLNPFRLYTINASGKSILYLFTDGYADQFGGEKGKKLKFRNFCTLLQETSSLTMTEQQLRLATYFEKWRGPLEQIDDVLVMGIQI